MQIFLYFARKNVKILWSDVEKFMFLLTSHDLDICKVVILDVSNMYLVNQSMKQNLLDNFLFNRYFTI